MEEKKNEELQKEINILAIYRCSCFVLCRKEKN